jgi:hypothetical protein
MTRKTQTLKKVKSQLHKTRKVRKHKGGVWGPAEAAAALKARAARNTELAYRQASKYGRTVSKSGLAAAAADRLIRYGRG